MIEPNRKEYFDGKIDTKILVKKRFTDKLEAYHKMVESIEAESYYVSKDHLIKICCDVLNGTLEVDELDRKGFIRTEAKV